MSPSDEIHDALRPRVSVAADGADEAFSASDVKARAASGVLLLLGRGVLLQAVAFLGNLVLARLLLPRDFGLVAIGLTVVNVGQLLAGAGIGSALIAREEPPTKHELQALVGLQLVLSTVIAGIAAGIAIAVGNAALVTGLIVLALPFTALRTPALLLFERRLQFLAQLKVEVAETVIYLALAVAGAAAGLGAWSLGVATVARAITGTGVANVLCPVGFLVPSLRFSRLASIVGFGWRFQATGVSQLIQDSALTAGIGVIAGLGPLGLWAFAGRILKIPQLLFEAIWRVGFPAFSRLIQSDSNQSTAALLERTVGTFAAGVSLLLCPFVASSPATIPLLFGDKWTDVSLILAGSLIALTVGGPTGIAGNAYLLAKGDASTGLLATTLRGLVQLPVTFALLPSLGVAAIGIGWAAGVVVAMPLVVVRAQRASAARLTSRVVGPAFSGTAGGLGGWLVADALGATVSSAVIAASLACAVWSLLMLLVARATLFDALKTVRNLFGTVFRRKRAIAHPAAVAAPSSTA
jgi:O-antigen/teichoic acid export membrane protein